MAARSWHNVPKDHWFRGHTPPMDGKFRDTQRSRAYRAEGVLTKGAELMTMAQVRRWVWSLQDTDWWARRANAQGIKVRRAEIMDGRGRRSACAKGTWGLALPTWARTVPTLCHEVAHLITTVRPGHGPQWAAAYLDVVAFRMGQDAASALRESFRTHGVRFTPYRSPRTADRLVGTTPDGSQALAEHRAQALAQAMAVFCPKCHAAAGERCHNRVRQVVVGKAKVGPGAAPGTSATITKAIWIREPVKTAHRVRMEEGRKAADS